MRKYFAKLAPEYRTILEQRIQEVDNIDEWLFICFVLGLDDGHPLDLILSLLSVTSQKIYKIIAKLSDSLIYYFLNFKLLKDIVLQTS
jgi:hypothetical protein